MPRKQNVGNAFSLGRSLSCFPERAGGDEVSKMFMYFQATP